MKLFHFFVIIVLGAIILFSGCAVMSRNRYNEDLAHERLEGRMEAFNECIKILNNMALAIEQGKYVDVSTAEQGGSHGR
jgi:hypothetical protein